MDNTVLIDRGRAERIWLFLREFADYGYRYGVPEDLVELARECLVADDTKRSSWGLGDEQDAEAFVAAIRLEAS